VFGIRQRSQHVLPIQVDAGGQGCAIALVCNRKFARFARPVPRHHQRFGHRPAAHQCAVANPRRHDVVARIARERHRAQRDAASKPGGSASVAMTSNAALNLPWLRNTSPSSMATSSRAGTRAAGSHSNASACAT